MLHTSFLPGRAVNCPVGLRGTQLRIACPNQRGQKCAVRMSMMAPPVEIKVQKVDGPSEGTETLSLKVADKDKAKGIVHRYLMKVRGDMRLVSWPPQTNHS